MPRYRVRFFELLNQRTESEYVVFHGDPPSGLGYDAAVGPFEFPNVRVQNHELVLPGPRSITYQPVLRRIRRGGFDGVVLGTHLQFVSNHAVFAMHRLSGGAVLYWGHGDEKVADFQSDRTLRGWRLGTMLARLAHAGVKLKYAASTLPDGYLVYTEGGARRLLTNGVEAERITVVRNTLDMDEQFQLHEQGLTREESSLRRDLGLDADAVILVYVGRIYPAKRLEDLVTAVRRLNSVGRTTRRFQVVIIGDGPAAEDIRARAVGLDNLIFAGSIHDQALLSRYLQVASAMVIPGIVGLVANHALAHGLPIVTQATNAHGPEMEYLTPGSDTLIGQDFDSFVDLLGQLINSPELVRELSARALAAREKLSLEAMVGAFHQGVASAVVRKRGGSPVSAQVAHV